MAEQITAAVRNRRTTHSEVHTALHGLFMHAITQPKPTIATCRMKSGCSAPVPGSTAGTRVIVILPPMSSDGANCSWPCVCTPATAAAAVKLAPCS